LTPLPEIVDGDSMNKRKLIEKNVGHVVRLRPKAVDARERDEDFDDEWFVLRGDLKTGFTLQNQRTRHHLELGFDNIKSFQSPHFLNLDCQVTINAQRVGATAEPLQNVRVPRTRPEEVLMQALRDSVPFIPAMTPGRIEALLKDEKRRRAWFAKKERDEPGGVFLVTSNYENGGRIGIHVPLKLLHEARRKLIERNQDAQRDPLDDW
jgi:hypothetical protein